MRAVRVIILLNNPRFKFIHFPEKCSAAAGQGLELTFFEFQQVISGVSDSSRAHWNGVNL